MAPFVVVRESTAAPARLWSVVSDFAGYERWIPLTVMDHDPGDPGVGWTFVGLTGLGRARFADPMTIEQWEPPAAGAPAAAPGELVAQFRVRKVGRVLAGWAHVQVLAGADPGASLLLWREEIILRPPRVGRWLSWGLDPLNQALFARAIDLMVAHAEDTQARGYPARPVDDS